MTETVTVPKAEWEALVSDVAEIRGAIQQLFEVIVLAQGPEDQEADGLDTFPGFAAYRANQKERGNA